MQLKQCLFVVALLGSCAPLLAQTLKVKSATRAAELDSLFERKEGWIGGDGAYSAVDSNGRTFWLFSDTWVGRIVDGRRVDATLVNNTIGIQNSPDAAPIYSIRRDKDGKAEAMIRPVDGRGWYWIQAGVVIRNELLFFLNQIEKTGDEGVFGFRSIGMWLGKVSNCDQPPESWKVEQIKLPNTEFSDNRTLVWGAAVLLHNDELYVYGTDERRTKGIPDRTMVIAKVPSNSVSDFSKWRYWREESWQEDFRHPTSMAGGIAAEYSVTPLGKEFVTIYTSIGLSPKIVARTAKQPWGPWSTETKLYECPEMSQDKKLFTYAAKAQPTLAAKNELIITYVVNSFDFWQVAREANLYWPRFVRVTLE